LIETLQINEFPASSRDALVTNNYLTRANEADNNGVEPGSSSAAQGFLDKRVWRANARRNLPQSTRSRLSPGQQTGSKRLKSASLNHAKSDRGRLKKPHE
jgi:hypothetical protein